MADNDPITWHERDAGQKFSIVILIFLAVVFWLFVIVTGVDHMLNGSGLMVKIAGGGQVLISISIAVRVARWWKARNAPR